MKTKEYLGMEMDFYFFRLTHKQSAIAAGSMAQILIFVSVLDMEINLLFSVLRVLYAFLILLPISYYNMREHEKEAV